MDPQVEQLGVQLTAYAVQNTAAAIGDKIRALRASRDDRRTIEELEDIINKLISERSEIIRIAQAYEQELVSQQISDADIDYLTEHLIPLAEHFVSTGDDPETSREALERIEPLLSAQTITILQLIGFNFKRAIGEPLTDILAKFILSKAPVSGISKEAYDLQVAEMNTLCYKVILDPDSFNRLKSIQQPVNPT